MARKPKSGNSSAPSEPKAKESEQADSCDTPQLPIPSAFANLPDCPLRAALIAARTGKSSEVSERLDLCPLARAVRDGHPAMQVGRDMMAALRLQHYGVPNPAGRATTIAHLPAGMILPPPM